MSPPRAQTRLRRLALFALVLGVGAIAALFWGRLKLVTGIPRTAYAEPDAHQPERLAASENAAPAPVE